MMDVLKLLGILAIFPGSIIAIFVLGYLECKKEERKHAQAKAEVEAWLVKEKAEGEKWYVAITLKNGDRKVSTNVEPDYFWGFRNYIKRKSEDRAKEWAREIGKGESFTVGLETFPHHQIAKAEACRNS